MGLMDKLAVEIASILQALSEGFIEAIRTQSILISNLIALTPIIAPIIHLIRLIYASERVKEAETIIKGLER